MMQYSTSIIHNEMRTSLFILYIVYHMILTEIQPEFIPGARIKVI